MKISKVISAVASVLFVFVMPGLAAPAVTWTPGMVSASLLQGTQDLVTVSLLSELSNIDVRVSRNIRPFVSVNPSHFDAVHKNVPITLVLTFSATQRALAKEYQGKVRLRTGRSNDDDNEDRDSISPALPIDLTATNHTHQDR